MEKRKKREAFSWKTQIPTSCDERRGILLPSKLVCHRVRLSQPALMIKIMSVLRWSKEKRSKKYKRGTGEKLEKRRHLPLPGHPSGIYLLRSDTSNWLWNVSSHITAILMSWPAESIVEKISLSIADNTVESITGDERNKRGARERKRERDKIRSPWRFPLVVYV